MSKILTFTIGDDDYASLLQYALIYPDPVNGALQSNPSAGILSMFRGQMLNPALNAFKPSAVVTALAALETSRAAVNALVYPTIDSWAFEFDVSCATPSSIANGTNGSTSFAVDVLDPGYAGTIVMDLLDPNVQGITGAFSPSSFTASGSGTLVITVPGGVPAGAYDLIVQGTDGDDIINRVIISLTVT